MDLAELKRWRKLVPAFMIACAVWPLIQSFLKFITKDLGYVGDDDKLFSLMLAGLGVPVAVIYDALDFRRIISWTGEVRAEIAMSVWKIILRAAKDFNLGAEMPREGDMMRLFYKQVDSDSSLKELASRIRSNGLAASSCVDGCLILGAFGAITIFVSIFVDNLALIVWDMLLSLSSSICYLLVPFIKRRHLRLAREQIEHLELFGEESIVKDYKMMVGKSG